MGLKGLRFLRVQIYALFCSRQNFYTFYALFLRIFIIFHISAFLFSRFFRIFATV